MVYLDQRFDLGPLRVAAPPYLHLLASTDVDAGILCATFDHRGMVGRLLRGRQMQSSAGVWGEFAAALQFPYYFGYNWAAFNECISEIDWFPPIGLVIGVMGAGLLLQEQPSLLAPLVEIINSAGDGYSRPINRGDGADRPAFPFHVVFQEEGAKLVELRERLLAAGAILDDIAPLPR